MTGTRIQVNGTTLYCEATGAGEPILFSHGLLWSTTMFDAQVAALNADYHCLAYDHRGQGRSADDTCDTVDVDTLCADAVALINELGVGPVHFVGHSLGGFVGMRLAVRHPELVQSLTLCNTSADVEPQHNVGKYRLMALAARWLGPRFVVNAMMPIAHGKTALSDPSRRVQLDAWREQMARNKRSIFRAANGVISRTSIHADLHKVTAPTLVLVGQEDLARSLAEGQRIADAIQGAKLLCVPSAGHMLPLEEPEAVNAALKEFLTGVRQQGARK